MSIVTKIFGSRNQRELNRIQKQVDKINTFSEHYGAFKDEDFPKETALLKQKIEQGASLDQLLPSAFALVREAATRSLGLRHYDVQLAGGVILHEGKIAEMSTGEGKTLVATLAVYLNALSGKGVHVVTVNSYLAQRDTQWMGKLYEFLGLTVGVNHEGLDFDQKRDAYAADITYGTNNEFGFDYLRDNMAFALEQRVQRALGFAVVDEVDSVLIDEARTPLIISGESEESVNVYGTIHEIAMQLVVQESEEKPGDFTLNEKEKTAHLTDEGFQKIETVLLEQGLLHKDSGLYQIENIKLLHHLMAALRARCLFKRDVDYIVQQGEIVIIDEHTGRSMPGRRWSEGLHQAIEAKEGVKINKESHTLASITFQNYFRLYAKLAGMTGTADTEAYELRQIYGLEVLIVPTHRPMVRKDYNDLIYMSAKDKFDAIVVELKRRHETGQPILVGTASIEVSEHIASLLKKAGIPHQVLNAKQHEKEAHVIEQAGYLGAITIATNMAGRGTDIVLGGNVDAKIAAMKSPSEKVVQRLRDQWDQDNAKVKSLGGLFVLGTERHESRRIDNQLRGRSARQGDPGESLFYLSLEDHLLRIFASDRVSAIMRSLNSEDGAPLAASMLNRAIEGAQKKVEGYHFDIRKQLLRFDDVANEQRKIIYKQRYELMASDSIHEWLDDLRHEVIVDLVAQHLPEGDDEHWKIDELITLLKDSFHCQVDLTAWIAKQSHVTQHQVIDYLDEALAHHIKQVLSELSEEARNQYEKTMMLHQLDWHWKEYLVAMDHLKQGIHLRAYAQKDPIQEYKKESFQLFQELLVAIRHDVISKLAQFKVDDQMRRAAEPASRSPFGLASPYSMQEHGVVFTHEDDAK